MRNHEYPDIGHWYQDGLRTAMFEVVAVDKDGGVEVQHFDGEIEEVDRDVIYRAILDQDNAVLYTLLVKDEKYCNKLIISAQNSELMYYDSSSPEKCKLSNKDLEALNNLKKETMKGFG